MTFETKTAPVAAALPYTVEYLEKVWMIRYRHQKVVWKILQISYSKLMLVIFDDININILTQFLPRRSYTYATFAQTVLWFAHAAKHHAMYTARLILYVSHRHCSSGHVRAIIFSWAKVLLFTEQNIYIPWRAQNVTIKNDRFWMIYKICLNLAYFNVIYQSVTNKRCPLQDISHPKSLSTNELVIS